MAWQAPREHRGILVAPPIAEVGALIEVNRARLGAWAERRRQAAAEILELARRYLAGLDIPVPEIRAQRLAVIGHQPDLFHPGVWIKNFAIGSLANRHGLTPLNLIVDNDVAKVPAIHVPVGAPEKARRVPILFDHWSGPLPYEEWSVQDETAFAAFPDNVGQVLGEPNWQPFLAKFWCDVQNAALHTRVVGERFAIARHRWEERWGCRNLELPMSRLADSRAFRSFVADVLVDASRFAAIHNEALASFRTKHHIRSRHHPVPDLAKESNWHEVPFWTWRARDAQRRRLFVCSDGGLLELRAGDVSLGRIPAGNAAAGLDTMRQSGWKIRPRALTTTLFARLFLADVFVHGIGGAIYDELTDELIRRFFDLEPPGFMVVSGTLRLPRPPCEPSSPSRLVKQQLRRIWYNPDRYINQSQKQKLDALCRLKQELVAEQPEESEAKRARFQAILTLNEQLRPSVAWQYVALRQELECAEDREQSEAVWQDREFAFCLYPEDELASWFKQI